MNYKPHIRKVDDTAELHGTVDCQARRASAPSQASILIIRRPWQGEATLQKMPEA